MREYELIFIVHPDSDEKAFNEIIERVTGWITDSGGQVLNTDIWGTRKLAYLINKQEEGQYVFMLINTDPAFGSELERNLRLLEQIMRFSLIATGN